MDIVIVGYSGHAFTSIDNLLSNGHRIMGYVEVDEKELNPYNLKYLGSEHAESVLDIMAKHNYFVAVGETNLRQKITNHIMNKIDKQPINCIHASAILGSHIDLGHGVFIGASSIVNSNAKIGNGVICNTGCIIEHEVVLKPYSFVGPGSTLCGNVLVGECSFVGANATVLPGKSIGEKSIIGAGSVIIENVSDNVTVVGNPGRLI